MAGSKCITSDCFAASYWRCPMAFDCRWCLSWWVDSSPTGNHLKSSCISHVADPARGAPSGSSFDRRSDHVGGDIFQGQGRETTFCPNDPGNQGKSAGWCAKIPKIPSGWGKKMDQAWCETFECVTASPQWTRLLARAQESRDIKVLSGLYPALAGDELVHSSLFIHFPVCDPLVGCNLWDPLC